jgi:hypothetical protein
LSRLASLSSCSSLPTVCSSEKILSINGGTDPIAQRSAKVSANSFLRAARSLFSPKIVKHLSLELPSTLPFTDCQFEPRPSSKYRSSFDILAVIEAANRELAGTDPEAYKVFLLGTMVGLRRKEIDLLEWSSFRWAEGAIRVEPTQYFSPKSEDSIGDVAADAEFIAIFRGFAASDETVELKPGQGAGA